MCEIKINFIEINWLKMRFEMITSVRAGLRALPNCLSTFSSIFSPWLINSGFPSPALAIPLINSLLQERNKLTTHPFKKKSSRFSRRKFFLPRFSTDSKGEYSGCVCVLFHCVDTLGSVADFTISQHKQLSRYSFFRILFKYVQ